MTRTSPAEDPTISLAAENNLRSPESITNDPLSAGNIFETLKNKLEAGFGECIYKLSDGKLFNLICCLVYLQGSCTTTLIHISNY